MDGEEPIFEILTTHAYDWVVRDLFSDDNHAVIHCWSLDQESKPYLLRILDFPVFCHVELPLFVHNNLYDWGKTGRITAFNKFLSDRLREDAPTREVFSSSKKLYFYRGDRKFPMMQLQFNSLKAMRHCVNLLAEPIKTDDWGFIQFNVWEDSISMVRKLLTVRDIRFSQWFQVVGEKVEPDLKIASIEREYIVRWETMTVVPPEECKNWHTQPGVLAFDIECYSNNHRAMPDKYNALHVAYMISCIFQRYKQSKTRKRYGIIIGNCKHIPEEKLDNCEIIQVNTELEMVDAFAKVVLETDPEVLTGYNILGFDYFYLDVRVRRWLREWPSMGRIIGDATTMNRKTWQSSAYGHQTLNILQAEGRISIDLLPIVKRDYKLDKYTLDFVCMHFIKKTKHDIKASEMFLIYEDMRNSKAALDEIEQYINDNPDLKSDSEFIWKLEDAREKFDEAEKETTRVMEYCIQDSELVIELMEKLNVWVGLVEMSNIVGVTIVELFTRGQQIRCMSQLYDLAARTGFVLDKRDSPGFKFAGGYVHDPIPGLYDNVICLDFASLYPSIMMAYNICYTTLVPPELESIVPPNQCHIIEFDQEETENIEEEEEEFDEILQELVKKKKEKVSKTVMKHYRFMFYKETEGILPRLERQLVAERRGVKKQIKELENQVEALLRIQNIYSLLEAYFKKI